MLEGPEDLPNESILYCTTQPGVGKGLVFTGERERNQFAMIPAFLFAGSTSPFVRPVFVKFFACLNVFLVLPDCLMYSSQ